MKLPTLKIDAFQLIYVVIAIATALHTAWGAARTMQGIMPDDVAGQVIWWTQGLFFAIAIDWAMYVIAIRIRGGNATWQTVVFLIVSFILAASFSSFFQLLYAWVHSAPIIASEGVVQEWQERLGGVINSATVIVPLMLPGISIVYTLSGITRHKVATTKAPDMPVVVREDKPFISTSAQLNSDVQEVKALPARTSVKSPKGKAVPSAKRMVVCPGCSGEFAPGSVWRHKQKCSEYQAMIVRVGSEVEVQ